MSGLDWHVQKERQRPKIHLHFLILSIIIQAFGAVLTKYAAEWNSSDLIQGIRVDLIFYLIILVCMGLQVVVWQYALKYYSLSFAYPFRSLVSFIVLFSAVLLFNETISLMNILGLSVITLGVFFLASDKEILS
jgi:multidrug transporter EmrE-like cation transporter